MSHTDTTDFRDLQQAFTRFIRDPEHAEAPAGSDPERMRHYARLFFNNIDGILEQALDRFRTTFDDAEWDALTHRFFRDCPQHSPFLVDVPARFVEFLDDVALTDWQRDLARYDLAEFQVLTEDDEPSNTVVESDGDPMAAPLVVNPEGQLFASAYAVHQFDMAAPRTPPPAEPTFLFLRRQPDGGIALTTLSPASARLLELIELAPDDTGEALLGRLAEELGATLEQIRDFGAQQYRQWLEEGLLIGTRTTDA